MPQGSQILITFPFLGQIALLFQSQSPFVKGVARGAQVDRTRLTSFPLCLYHVTAVLPPFADQGQLLVTRWWLFFTWWVLDTRNPKCTRASGSAEFIVTFVPLEQRTSDAADPRAVAWGSESLGVVLDHSCFHLSLSGSQYSSYWWHRSILKVSDPTCALKMGGRHPILTGCCLQAGAWAVPVAHSSSTLPGHRHLSDTIGRPHVPEPTPISISLQRGKRAWTDASLYGILCLRIRHSII